MGTSRGLVATGNCHIRSKKIDECKSTAKRESTSSKFKEKRDRGPTEIPSALVRRHYSPAELMLKGYGDYIKDKTIYITQEGSISETVERLFSITKDSSVKDT